MSSNRIVVHECRNCRVSSEFSSACMRSRLRHTTVRISTLTIRSRSAVYSVDPVQLLTGSLPIRQQRLVEAWAEHAELTHDWQLLQQGQPPEPIAPLQ